VTLSLRLRSARIAKCLSRITRLEIALFGFTQMSLVQNGNALVPEFDEGVDDGADEVDGSHDNQDERASKDESSRSTIGDGGSGNGADVIRHEDSRNEVFEEDDTDTTATETLLLRHRRAPLGSRFQDNQIQDSRLELRHLIWQELMIQESWMFMSSVRNSYSVSTNWRNASVCTNTTNSI